MASLAPDGPNGGLSAAAGAVPGAAPAPDATAEADGTLTMGERWNMDEDAATDLGKVAGKNEND